MPKRSHRLEKPKWFDLRNYDALTNLNGLEWADQLDPRVRFFFPRDEFISVIDWVNAFSLFYKWEKESDPTGLLIFEAIREDPLKPEAKYIQELNRKFPKKSPLAESNSADPQSNKSEDNLSKLFNIGVHPLTMEEAFFLDEAIPREAKQILNEYWNDSDTFEADSARLSQKLDTYYKWRRYPVSLGEILERDDSEATNKIHLTIDLNLTNAQLLEEFRSLITLARSMDQFRVPKYSRDFLTRLVENRVLPYIDLLIYTKIEGEKIQEHYIGEWLFPSEDIVDTTEKIRKTTKPLAEKAIREAAYILGITKIG